MEYRRGERVIHLVMPDWGLGEVLENSSNESVRVYFVNTGEKKLVLKNLPLVKVSGEKAAHPVLDDLKFSKFANVVEYPSLQQSILHFLEKFPDGFYGNKYMKHERQNRDKEHALSKKLFENHIFNEQLEISAYSKISKQALKLFYSSNLIFPNEKIALKKYLENYEYQKEFCNSLFSLLYGAGELEQRFDDFSYTLHGIKAEKWAIVTYFMFVVHPDKYMFVKPISAQYASKLCRYEIHYMPQSNWLTYKYVLNFSEYLMSEISILKPRDMIDVQAFMRCITPGAYQGV